MSDSIEMSLGVALVLDEVVRKVMYAIKEENGEQIIVDRELPFRLRYRLNKNKMMLDKDVEWFNQQKMIALSKYGEPTEDGKSVVVRDPVKLEEYKEEIGRLIDTKVAHELVTIEPSDVELIEDPDITVSPDAMTLFIGYLTNDPDLERDLSFNINLKPVPEDFGKKVVEPVEEEKINNVESEVVEAKEEVKDQVVEEIAPEVKEDKPAKKASKKSDPKAKKEEGEKPVKKTSKKAKKE